MAISGRTRARLAEPFEGGSGPTHNVIERIFTAEDALDYLGEGNKAERVLHGLRALRDGRSTFGRPPLEPDRRKLARVAEHLAQDLLARGLVDEGAVAEALHVSPDSGETRLPRRGASVSVEGTVREHAEPHQEDAASRPPPSRDPRKVMVVYGHDREAARAMFDWLRSIGLHPAEWNALVAASGSGSPFIGEVLDRAFASAQAVVVLFTPDEHVRGRAELSAGSWRLQARPNVLFEAGMAFASHPEQTVIVVLGQQELPSDLAGRHYVRLDSVGALRDLAQRLEAAGCPVDLNGSDWLDITRFPDRDELDSEGF